MMGTAWPSERTRRSAAGFHGSFGSQRIWWYISTVTRWARDRAVEGWPLPAAVVISTLSLPRSIAFLWTALVKLIAGSPVGRLRVAACGVIGPLGRVAPTCGGAFGDVR